MIDLKKTLSDIAFELASGSKFHRVEGSSEFMTMFSKNSTDNGSYLFITIWKRNGRGRIDVDDGHETAAIRFDMDDEDVERLKNILEENLETGK